MALARGPDIGEWIAEIREDRAMTQVELAKKARISPSTLSLIESGKVGHPRQSTICKISWVLGVEPQVLRRPRESAASEDIVINMGVAELEASAEPAKVTAGVSIGLYWRVFEAAKGSRKLDPDELRRAEEVLEKSLVE
jgi:transcriptional regulator with XRE-family HTH domain